MNQSDITGTETRVPKCTVIIPSIGKPTLDRAVASALAQVGVEVEVQVVLNGPRAGDYSNPDPRVRVTRIEEPNANMARQWAVTHSDSPYFATLDDDDYWLVDKLQRQIEHVRTLREYDTRMWLAGCGVLEIEGSTVRTAPTNFGGDPSSPDVYLFRRRTVYADRRQLQSSTLLFPRELVAAVPFDPADTIHTDWGWAIECARRGASIVVVPEYLSFYVRNAASSVSAAGRAQDSYRWAARHLADSSSRVRGDFIAMISCGFASRAGDISGYFRTLRLAYTEGAPGIAAFLYSLRSVMRVLGRGWKRGIDRRSVIRTNARETSS